MSSARRLAGSRGDITCQIEDLGEAQPIDDAVELVGRRMGAGQFRAPDLAAALQRVSGLVYAPLAPHLTNVSHLIVCPDGQLSRLPFEMLRMSKPGGPPNPDRHPKLVRSCHGEIKQAGSAFSMCVQTVARSKHSWRIRASLRRLLQF